MNSTQELQLQIAKTAVHDWRTEEARAHDGIAHSRANALYSVRLAVEAGVSQATIAKACGWSRQRVYQLLNETR